MSKIIEIKKYKIPGYGHVNIKYDMGSDEFVAKVDGREYRAPMMNLVLDMVDRHISQARNISWVNVIKVRVDDPSRNIYKNVTNPRLAIKLERMTLGQLDDDNVLDVAYDTARPDIELPTASMGKSYVLDGHKLSDVPYAERSDRMRSQYALLEDDDQLWHNALLLDEATDKATAMLAHLIKEMMFPELRLFLVNLALKVSEATDEAFMEFMGEEKDYD